MFQSFLLTSGHNLYPRAIPFRLAIRYKFATLDTRLIRSIVIVVHMYLSTVIKTFIFLNIKVLSMLNLVTIGIILIFYTVEGDEVSAICVCSCHNLIWSTGQDWFLPIQKLPVKRAAMSTSRQKPLTPSATRLRHQLHWPDSSSYRNHLSISLVYLLPCSLGVLSIAPAVCLFKKLGCWDV